ncbi:MAG TPA: nidogen-like domain-containing protein [Guyparkeria sp.]|nr:nidogen-like domain-containing protein [Guyparkeria sp.]
MNRFGISRLIPASLALASVFFVPVAFGQAIESGFNSNTLAANDDDSAGPVALGFTIDFFGVPLDELWVNNNGNVTFDEPQGAYTPYDLTSTGQQIIAPFFADVDTRNAGSPVTYGTGTFNGRQAFGVNWVNVDYYNSDLSHTNRNSFQLILVDRSDVSAGAFDIVFNYDKIEWEAGTASDGDSNGLGGDSARAGYSNGTGDPGTAFELPGSAVNGAFLDGGSNALVSNRLNSNVDGRYIMQSRGGTIDPGQPGGPSGAVSIPVNSAWMLALLGMLLALLAFGVTRQRDNG